MITNGDALIVGLCRFSFLGLGDWVTWRGDRSTDDARLDRVAADLYDDDRMARRFAAFQAVCLPSVCAQQDARLRFVILSSTRMPARWRARLETLCARDARLQIVWSDIPDTGQALRPLLDRFWQEAGGNLWQFRLDDDDAIAAGFTERLRGHAARMEGFDKAVVTLSGGIYLCLYPGQPVTALGYRNPFLGAGLALRLAEPGTSIFRFGHFALRDRFTHLVDHDAMGALVLRWPSDSVPLQLDALPHGVTPLRPRQWARDLARHFPMLDRAALEGLHPDT